jgi:hypothetical protein
MKQIDKIVELNDYQLWRKENFDDKNFTRNLIESNEKYDSPNKLTEEK